MSLIAALCLYWGIVILVAVAAGAGAAVFFLLGLAVPLGLAFGLDRLRRW